MMTFKTHRFSTLLLAALSVGLCGPQTANASCEKDEAECVEVGQWSFSVSLGYGSRSNPVISNDSVPIILLPGITYYGERFFWDNDFIGYTLNDSATHMVNAIATISYDQIYFNHWGVGNFFIDSGFSGSSIFGDFSGIGFSQPPVNNEQTYTQVGQVNSSSGTEGREESFDGPFTIQDVRSSQPEAIDLDDLHDRDFAVLGGIEYFYSRRHWSFALQALQDLSSVHSGKQARLSVGYDLAHKNALWQLSAGAEWKDAKTLDYYYGIYEYEVENRNNAYRVGDDISYYAKVNWEYKINDRWSWMAVLHNRWLGRNIQASPLVEESTVLTVFTGGVYHF